MVLDVLDRLSYAARVAAEAVCLGELADAASALAAVVGSTQFALCSFEASGRFVLQAGSGDLKASFGDYVSGVYPIDPLQERLLQLARFPVVANHAALGLDLAHFRRSEAYQGYFRRIGIDRMLVVTMTDQPYGAPGAAGMMFTRPANHEDFGELDARAASEVLPAFCAAARRHQRFAAIERERDQLAVAAESDGMARLLFDPSGRVVWRSPVAARWLDAEPPPDLVAAAGRLGALAAGGSLERGTVSRVVATLPDGRAVVADLSIVRTPTGEPLVQACLDAAGLGPGLLAEAARRFGLTRAEADVLNALIRGKTNAEAGRGLFVSQETIRTHVRRILGKLGVSSRHDVAAVVSRALHIAAA